MKLGADPRLRSTTSRVVTALFGIVLLGVAVYTLVSDDARWELGPLLVAAVTGLLGFDAVLSAIRNKTALVARIGPMP
jgi:hypothetical protein